MPTSPRRGSRPGSAWPRASSSGRWAPPPSAAPGCTSKSAGKAAPRTPWSGWINLDKRRLEAPATIEPLSPRGRLAIALASTLLVAYVALGSLLGRVLGDTTYGQLALFNEVLR